MNIKKLNGKSITLAYSVVLIILVLMAVVLNVSGNALLGNNLDVIASNKDINQEVNNDTQTDANANNESVDESETTQSTIDQDNSDTNQSSTQSNTTQKSNKQARNSQSSTPQPTPPQHNAPTPQTPPQGSKPQASAPQYTPPGRVVVAGVCPVVANFQYGDYSPGNNYDAIDKCFRNVLGLPNDIGISGWSDGSYGVVYNGISYAIAKGDNRIVYTVYN